MSDILIKRNHMEIPWHNYVSTRNNQPITEASLSEKASLIGRTGMMLLSCGTGAWRVRSSMNTLSEALGITCSADIGLMSISYTCFDGESSFSHALSLTTTGVNTSRLNRLEHFVSDFPAEGIHMSGEALHSQLDEIERIHGLYSPTALGLASALACGAFTFLLGGGPLEMILAFAGAGIGNAIRCKLGKHHFTLFMCIAVSVSSACLVYAGFLKLAELLFHISVQHEAGYICSMLFIIPGFPFITSGIDLAKLDMRSGLERLAYAIIVVMVADRLCLANGTASCICNRWISCLWSFRQLQRILFRLLASFCGVFGFSVMFNSPVRLAAAAAFIGALSNTLRLELVDLAGFPPAAAAFFGALTAGLLASLLKTKVGYPRISITVPSIVIMVPGLYLYRAIYNLGIMFLFLFRNRDNFFFKYDIGYTCFRSHLLVAISPFESYKHESKDKHITDKQPGTLFTFEICFRRFFNFHKLCFKIKCFSLRANVTQIF